MSETGIIDDDQDRKALENLVVDNPELEQLEALLDQFNIFEAMGAVRQELRHSDFLAFLLNPQQNHGLGDVFVKRLLQKAISPPHGVSPPITPIDLDIWSLDDIVVLREWQNIDILLLDAGHHLTVIIENKIDSGEHSDQLQRYRQAVRQHYSGWSVISLYLTPDRAIPSDDTYLPVDYSDVCKLIESLVEHKASTLGEDVCTLMTHYTKMLRRHIVSESEISELCQRIYQKHQRALDLIYEYKPDQQVTIREILERQIREATDLVLDHCSKMYIRFALEEWDIPALREGKGWTRSGRILLFEFANNTDNLKLRLHIGPGPISIRQKVFDMARSHQPLFRTGKSLNQQWNMIFDRSFLTAKSYEEVTTEKLEEEIHQHWAKFLEHDLPAIRSAIRELDLAAPDQLG